MGVKIEKAISWAVTIANNDYYGYVYGANGPQNYDCSAFMCAAYRQAGLSITRVGTAGMKAEFTKNGFTVVTGINTSTGSGLVRGDVLICSGHTVMYIGNGKIVHASSPTNGILVANYYQEKDRPWHTVLRYNEEPITMEGEFDMVCTYKISGGDGTVYYYDGAKLFALGDINEYNLLKTIYKSNTGKDMPLPTFTSAQHTHLSNVIKKRGI